MTISSSTNKSGPYNGNGSTTVFARTFRVLEADHLKVYQTISGVTTEVTTGITKDGIGSDSGNVTFATAPATGTQITLIREIPLTQETDYSAQGKVSPVQVEDDFDLQEMQVQDLSEKVERSIKVPITSSGDYTFPEPSSGKVMIGRSDGLGWETGPTGDEISSAQSYAEQAQKGHTFADRVTAEAATVVEGAVLIGVKQPSGLVVWYSLTDSNEPYPALTTNGGTKKWVPAYAISPQHYAENTTPGTTDMIVALETMFSYLSRNVSTEWQIVNKLAPNKVTGMGEVLAISRPLKIGVLDENQDGTYDSGTGALADVTARNMEIRAIGTWSSDIAGDTDVGRPIVFVGDYRSPLHSPSSPTDEFLVLRVMFEDVEFNCNFKADGPYFENTAWSGVRRGQTSNMRKDGKGLATSYQNGTLSTRGIATKNMEFVVDDHRIDGNNRFDGNSDWPFGEDINSMGVTNFALRSHDAMVNKLVTTNGAVSWDIHGRGCQFNQCHPWAKKVIIREESDNLKFTDTYWDFTNVELRSFGHSFIGGDLLLGDVNYKLIATTADETADGLLISDFRTNGTSTIEYLTEGVGTWVAAPDRKHVIGPNYCEANNIPRLQLGDKFRVSNNGAITTPTFSIDSLGQLNVGDGLRTDGGIVGRIDPDGDNLAIVPCDGSALLPNYRLEYNSAGANWSVGASYASPVTTFDMTNSRVGVNNASPAVALDVTGQVNADVFGGAGVVGTVSQSGGVSTGAILEYGSNANGEYIRYADGTQVCWRKITVTGQDINTAHGALFRSGNVIAGLQTYAASFASAASCTITSHTDGLVTMQAVGGIGDVNNTPSTVYVIHISSVTNRTIHINYVAFGRWY